MTRLILLVLILAGLASGEPYSRLKGCQSHGSPSLGGSWYGSRVHFGDLSTDYSMLVSSYSGTVTCEGPVLEDYYWVFPEGVHAWYDSLAWPPWNQLDVLAQLVPSAQVFPATLPDGSRITTRLQFVPDGFYLTRFLPQEGTQPDTSYLDAQVFQQYPEFPVLVIEGVSQVEGIAGQSFTLLSKDSLFITGDLIVSGTDTTSCGSPGAFGMTPEGSDILIGLISWNDVIIAATMENGGVNGSETPELMPCELEHSPVVETCGHGRKDVIISASIMALGSSFLTEYWTTSANVGFPPDPEPYMGCDISVPMGNYGIPGCDVYTGMYDLRGNIWFCGSVAIDCSGLFYRSMTLPSVGIGYTERYWRYDPNLLVSAPPFWPELEWIDADPPSFELSPVAQALCGQEPTGDEFLSAWQDSLLSVRITPHPDMGGGSEALRLRIWLDGRPISTRLDTLVTGSDVIHVPWAELPVEGSHQVYLTAEWDAQIWNAEGNDCIWSYSTVAVGESPRHLPADLALRIAPNPANPTFTIDYELPVAGETTLELYDLRGRKVRALVDGWSAAGSRRETVDLGPGASGLYFVRLVTPAGQRVEKVLVVR